MPFAWKKAGSKQPGSASTKKLFCKLLMKVGDYSNSSHLLNVRDRIQVLLFFWHCPKKGQKREFLSQDVGGKNARKSKAPPHNPQSSPHLAGFPVRPAGWGNCFPCTSFQNLAWELKIIHPPIVFKRLNKFSVALKLIRPGLWPRVGYTQSYRSLVVGENPGRNFWREPARCLN